MVKYPIRVPSVNSNPAICWMALISIVSERYILWIYVAEEADSVRNSAVHDLVAQNEVSETFSKEECLSKGTSSSGGELERISYVFGIWNFNPSRVLKAYFLMDATLFPQLLMEKLSKVYEELHNEQKKCRTIERQIRVSLTEEFLKMMEKSDEKWKWVLSSLHLVSGALEEGFHDSVRVSLLTKKILIVMLGDIWRLDRSCNSAERASECAHINRDLWVGTCRNEFTKWFCFPEQDFAQRRLAVQSCTKGDSPVWRNTMKTVSGSGSGTRRPEKTHPVGWR